MHIEIGPGSSRPGNARVESVYRNNRELVNREYTLPVPVVPLYEAPEVARTAGLRAAIEDHTRVIIMPSTKIALPPEQKKLATVLSSPYENGRVLEFDDTVIIDGEEYTLSLKGVGATTFCRETGNINPWRKMAGHTYDDELNKRLHEYPFWEYAGVLTRDEAFGELYQVREIAARGVDTEKILGIYHIEALPDRNGVLRPISYFVDRGIIPLDAEPVIMVRAMKSNLRLMDPILFEEIGKNEAIDPYLQHAIDEFGKRQGIEAPTAQQYFEWLAGKTLSQELPLIFDGYRMSSGRWHDLARNISTQGEEIDMDGVKKEEYLDISDYYRSINKHFSNLDLVLRKLLFLRNKTSSDKVDIAEYAEYYWQQLEGILTNLDYEAILQDVSRRIKGKNKNVAIEDFLWATRNNIYEVFHGLLGQASVGDFGVFEKHMQSKVREKMEREYPDDSIE